MSEKLSEARRLLKETGTAITKQNHVLYEFEEWEAIDKVVAELESCDLCDEPAEYRQCQGCMNDKLVGSHTDEEYKTLQQQVVKLEDRLKDATKWMTILLHESISFLKEKNELEAEMEKIRNYISDIDADVDAWGKNIIKWLIDDHTALQRKVERLWKFIKDNDFEMEWVDAMIKEGRDDETKNEIPPKVGREDVEHPHPGT